MANRFGASSLHQRDPRSALFENYNAGASPRNASSSPAPRGYGYNGGGSVGGYSGGGYGEREDRAGSAQGFRSATPNSSAPYVPRGQYSDAVLNELESQNNDQVEGIMGKVRQLKSMTIAIGDEIRESSALAEKMNDNFEGARVRIRGTMNRMLIMSQKTGVSWKVWILFFAAVFGLFFWVWVF
ncbi:similar to SNARE complex subunit (Bet1) [Botrytis cinerea T4]|uniref:Similar to SNARE complex subunit (Bet1) n=1 Tax=Botryotinia fuckeliana (strain T4) TaxID=999810 RepID=G2Y3S7_BOTF4|nr:similar to SNARE complex subunit (Bet1) [Botrytis cinerea T4]